MFRGTPHRQLLWTLRQIPAEDIWCDDTAIQQRSESRARPPSAQLRKDERHLLVLARNRPADAQGSIERFVEKFSELRERLGISSFMVGSLEELGPVVERLAGT